MTLPENDRVVQTLSANRANNAFNIRMLPRRTWRRNDLIEVECCYLASKQITVDRIPIPQQETWSIVQSEGFE